MSAKKKKTTRKPKPKSRVGIAPIKHSDPRHKARSGFTFLMREDRSDYDVEFHGAFISKRDLWFGFNAAYRAWVRERINVGREERKIDARLRRSKERAETAQTPVLPEENEIEAALPEDEIEITELTAGIQQI